MEKKQKKNIRNQVLKSIRWVVIVVAMIASMKETSTFLIDTVSYPACYHGLHFMSNGDFYFIQFNEEHEFLITDSEMQIVFRSNDVRIATPLGDIVKMELYDGRNAEVNVLTKKIDIEGFFV